MTKLDIINESAKLTGLTKVETELVFDSIINSIKISLSKGERVDIRGFGSFITKVKDEREARNPATNETFILEKRYIPSFKVSKLLKEFVDLEMKEIQEDFYMPCGKKRKKKKMNTHKRKKRLRANRHKKK